MLFFIDAQVYLTPSNYARDTLSSTRLKSPVHASSEGSHFWVAHAWQPSEAGLAMHWKRQFLTEHPEKSVKQDAHVSEIPVLDCMHFPVQLVSALH